MESLIDVIIPVYNGEVFIDIIIKTLEEQTFKNFRAIFVDDGSTDNSFNLLNEKLETASFEGLVVHKENGGLPSARNAGIKNADSEWVTFVDCDDKLDPHFLEYLYKGVTENRTVLGCCGFQPVPTDEQHKIKPVEQYDCEVISAEQCMKDYYINWVGACCLIVNRKWLVDNDLFFDESCTYCEDIPFITRVIEAVDKVARIKADTYLYLLRQGSLIRSPKIEKYGVGISAFLRMVEQLEAKTSKAAEVFRGVGKARYMIATLRKGAVQLPFASFKELTKLIDIKLFKDQIKNLTMSQRIAGYIYLFSKTAFYYSIRLIFKD